MHRAFVRAFQTPAAYRQSIRSNGRFRDGTSAEV